ncbi:TrkH family potassium uptake protein [Dermatophilus congolensis]|uniref:Ktr system potassium uptake protein B n=1 Tax=Dermatophilus congolensis TaxID=1863 RepID=A0A239VTZ6_9MICO|nr:potassium transporter TrkG [Dermatophilus congolensis]SNV25602.1 Ktr system potassium uptake protein B [Dermatophilus congolensis]
MVSLWRRQGRWLASPVRLVPVAFILFMALGTALLALPISHPGEVDYLASAFTAVSATCITGLTVVDTATYWTPFGKAVIIVLTQLGGFGIMSAATLFALAINGRLDLTGTLVAQTEKQTRTLGEVRRVITRIAAVMLTLEILAGIILTIRLLIRGEPFSGAVLHGFFYSAMGFTNAGFTPDAGLVKYVGDPWIMWPLFLLIILGSLGYPVLFELQNKWRRPHHWSVHMRLTFWGFLFLMVVGVSYFALFEWNNPGTLGPLNVMGKINGALAGGIMPRSAGFSAVDYAQITDESTVATIVLMFIGGGSAGTSGGLKVSTFFLLAFVILAEIRGEHDVTVGHRSVSNATIRQALAIALLSVGVVTASAVILVSLTELPLIAVLFDVVSAFATCGLSLGITPDLPPGGQVLLMVLMFIGRVGTVTVASALALRTRQRHYHLPNEAPIVG